MEQTTTDEVIDSRDVVLPVVREELQIAKQKMSTGSVLIRKSVHEREEVVDEPLFANQVDIERIPIGRVVESPIPVRQEGDVTVISVVEETLVLTKQLVLKEEIRVSNRRSETRNPQRMTLRSEEITVERENNASPSASQQNLPPIATASSGSNLGIFQEGTMELVETAEQLTVSKVARVVEELIVTKEVHQHEQTVNETVRHTDIEIEQIVPDKSQPPGNPGPIKR